jgi:hypothetical protein
MVLQLRSYAWGLQLLTLKISMLRLFFMSLGLEWILLINDVSEGI